MSSRPVPPTDKRRRPAPAARARLPALIEAIEHHGGRLTPMREWVLRQLAAAEGAVSAYDLIERRSAETGRKVGPPTIYRALEFLEEMGVVDRLVSRNAYVLCMGPHDHGSGEAVFYHCRSCGRTSEVADPELGRLIAGHARTLGFDTERPTLEVAGRCEACRKA
ncbi:MAG: transcriptional repressor [Alphaproteobacteria bacterium]|nr:transcriptional repressor [Alphaproteobacteria bacterium]